MRLFHFSECGDLARFTPRPVLVPSVRPPGDEWLNGPLVWAVTEERQGTYLFARDCPRVVIWPIASTTDADRERWCGDAAMVAYVEETWWQRVADEVLFRYELPADSFTLVEEWMAVSTEPVTPCAVTRVDDLAGALATCGVVVRVRDDLTALRELWSTSLHVSGIRLRNAQGW